MKKIITMVLGTMLFVTTVKAQWNVKTIGTMPNANALSIVVADGRNDGVKRVYATTNTEIWEWTYSSGTWNSSLVVNGITPDKISLAAGDGRNDGNIRLYYTDWADGGSINEASWTGSSWSIVTVGSSPSGWHSSGLIVGKGRNDGSNRVYSVGSYGIREHSWNGSSWSMSNNVASNWSEMYGAVGDVRNDGVQRVVFNASCHWESTWGGSSYNTSGVTNCSSSQGADDITIGDGRNDGVNRIYVNTEVAGRIEYTWNGSAYTPMQIRQATQRGDIHLAALKSDQKNRIYMGNSYKFNQSVSGPIYEYEWNNTTNQWDSVGVVISAISGATAFMDAGSARNDDTLRLYTPNFATGAIYEITAANPNYVGLSTSIEKVSEAVEIVVSPNPSNGYFTIKMDKIIESEVGLAVYDLLGKEIVNVSNVDASEPYLLNMINYPKGVYILKLSDKSKLLSIQKIIID